MSAERDPDPFPWQDQGQSSSIAPDSLLQVSLYSPSSTKRGNEITEDHYAARGVTEKASWQRREHVQRTLCVCVFERETETGTETE